MVRYVIDPDSGFLYKGVGEEDNFPEMCYGWHIIKKKWVECWESSCGMFIGFEPARKISKEEAMKITGGVE